MLDLGLETKVSTFKPNCIVPNMSEQVFTGISENTKRIARDLMSAGWRFYCVDQVRGRCYYSDKVITLPLWIVQNKSQAAQPGYREYYICHEMAHALDKTRSNHGPEFMQILQRICPVEYVHYEIGYKPRNAIAAGIGKPKDKPTTLLDL